MENWTSLWCLVRDDLGLVHSWHPFSVARCSVSEWRRLSWLHCFEVWLYIQLAHKAAHRGLCDTHRATQRGFSDIDRGLCDIHRATQGGLCNFATNCAISNPPWIERFLRQEGVQICWLYTHFLVTLNLSASDVFNPWEYALQLLLLLRLTIVFGRVWTFEELNLTVEQFLQLDLAATLG